MKSPTLASIVGQGTTGSGIFRSKSKSNVYSHGLSSSLAHSLSPSVMVTVAANSASAPVQLTGFLMVTAPVAPPPPPPPPPPTLRLGHGMMGSGIFRSKSKSKVYSQSPSLVQSASPSVILTVAVNSASAPVQPVAGSIVTAPLAPPPSPALIVGQGMTGSGIFRSKSKSNVYSHGSSSSLAHSLSPSVILTVAVNSGSAPVQPVGGFMVTAPVAPPPSPALILGQGIIGSGIFRSKSKSNVYSHGESSSLAHSFSPSVMLTVAVNSASAPVQPVAGNIVTAPVAPPPAPALISGQGMTGLGIFRSKSKSKV